MGNFLDCFSLEMLFRRFSFAQLFYNPKEKYTLTTTKNST